MFSWFSWKFPNAVAWLWFMRPSTSGTLVEMGGS